MMRHALRLRVILLALCLACVRPAFAQEAVPGAPQDPTPVIHVDNPPNTPSQQAEHYVVLVSLDGFRYDYPRLYGAPHLAELAAHGASAPEGMLPSYPSLTFPNHYTIVTGLYPEHHGLVANVFRDPAHEGTYYYNRAESDRDGSWYGGTPLWSLAEQQGMRAACLFWPGSEAEIAGKRPSYYLHFDDKLDDRRRIDQVIAWLQLPPEQRPHFITLYYSNVDHAGHNFGPDSNEVRDAVHHLDDMIGELDARLRSLHLPIDLVVVSDHGMIRLKQPPVVLSDLADLKDVFSTGTLLYPKTDADADRVYRELGQHAGSSYSVYRRADVPAALHYNESPREGDPVVVPHAPYDVTERGGEYSPVASHGFDPAATPEMKAIFFAAGPDIKHGVKLATFENVNIYPLLAHILGLSAPAVDGKLDILEDILNGAARSLGDRQVEGVSPPVLIYTGDPKAAGIMKKVKGPGKVIVYLWVEKDGSPSHLRIAHGSSDEGLNQKALEIVSGYRFKPSIKDGNPVVVELQIEVNFQEF